MNNTHTICEIKHGYGRTCDDDDDDDDADDNMDVPSTHGDFHGFTLPRWLVGCESSFCP